MAVVIRLKRAGAKKRPFYRVVVADSRRQRDGRFIEILGFYDPIAKPAKVELELDKVQGWIDNGARPSEQVASLLRQAGMKLGKPSKPTRKPAAAEKKPVKRAKPRPLSARKLKVKAAKKAARKKAAAK